MRCTQSYCKQNSKHDEFPHLARTVPGQVTVFSELRDEIQLLPKVTVAFFGYNHAQFAEECIKSAISIFPIGTPFVLVDAGSKDETVEVAKSALSRWSYRLVTPPEGMRWTAGECLRGIEELISSEYLIVISLDDTFVTEYWAEVERIVLSPGSQVVAINVALNECDAELRVTGRRKPKWTGWRWLDGLQIYVRNPGLAPGSVIPWNALKETGFFKDTMVQTIEDYPMWLYLAPRTRFLAIDTPLVNYRRHESAVSSQISNRAYAESLAGCVVLARKMAKNPVQHLLVRILRIRWKRKINVYVRSDFSRASS